MNAARQPRVEPPVRTTGPLAPIPPDWLASGAEIPCTPATLRILADALRDVNGELVTVVQAARAETRAMDAFLLRFFERGAKEGGGAELASAMDRVNAASDNLARVVRHHPEDPPPPLVVAL